MPPPQYHGSHFQPSPLPVRHHLVPVPVPVPEPVLFAPPAPTVGGAYGAPIDTSSPTDDAGPIEAPLHPVMCPPIPAAPLAPPPPPPGPEPPASDLPHEKQAQRETTEASPVAAASAPAPVKQASAPDVPSPVEPTPEAAPAPTGGDVRDCLDASELDTLITPFIPAHYVSAFKLYQVRVGELNPKLVATTIVTKLKRHGWVLAPIHVAYHWATAFFGLNPDGSVATLIYDSAPSAQTEPMFADVIARLGFPAPRIVSHAKQPRHSNECGVHVVWLAAMQTNLSKVPFLPAFALPPNHPPLVSLAQFRTLMAEWHPRSLSKAVAAQLCDTAPRLERAPAPAPTGGAPCRKIERPRPLRNVNVTCYVNAVLQALAATAETPEAGGPLREALAHLSGNPQPDEAAYLVPTPLRAIMKEAGGHATLAEVGQQDASEFWTHLAGSTEAVRRQFTTAHVTAVLRKGETEETLNTAESAQVDVPLTKTSFVQCLRDYSTPSYFEATPKDPAGRTTDTFAPLSKCCVFTVKRFDRSRKLKGPIDLPVTFVHDGVRYDVTAVVNHAGTSPRSGHYTATVKRADKWWLADDDSITEVADPTPALRSAYMIFCRVRHVNVPEEISDSDPDVDDDARTKKVREREEAQSRHDNKRRTNDLAPGTFMHSTTIDAYIANLRKHEKRAVTYFDTDAVSMARRLSKAKPGSEEYTRNLELLRRSYAPGHHHVWVACVDKHFFTVVCGHGETVCRAYDSLLSYGRKTTENTASAIATTMAALESASPRTVQVEAPPQQRKGSNDCARHAVRTAWTLGASFKVTLPTRADIVDCAAPPQLDDPPQPTFVPDETYAVTYKVNLGKIMPKADFEQLRKRVRDTLRDAAVKRKRQKELVAIQGVSALDSLKHIKIEFFVKGAALASTDSALRALLPGASLQRTFAVAPEQPEYQQLAKTVVEPEKRGKIVEFTYTLLKPGDPRRDLLHQLRTADANRTVIVLRVDDETGDTVRCPVCPADAPAAYTKNGKYGPVPSIKYHMLAQHNLATRPIPLVDCPCKPDAKDKDHCGAKVLKAAAAAKDKSEKPFVPHADATLCSICNTWWGNRSAKLRASVHPCIPCRPNQYVDPWPLAEKQDDSDVPVGVETLTPSPDRPADADALIEKPDFPTGEAPTRLGRLAQTPVGSLTILKTADRDLAPALVRKAFAYATRQSHVRMLTAVGDAASELVATDDPRQHQPIVPWLLSWLKARSRAKRWKWSTLNGNLSVLQSAFKYLPTYVRGAPTWQLSEDVSWKLAARTTRTKTAADLPSQALPATAQQVLKACRFAAKTDAETAFLLAVTWVTYGRSGALIQLRREDIDLKPVDDLKKRWWFRITLMRGKSNRLGQEPHTVTGHLGEFSPFVVPIVNRVQDPKAFIVNAPSRQNREKRRNLMKVMLRNGNNEPRLETRSLRRGSLQTLADAGAKMAVILACSGHSSPKSLKRYLNFGRVLTEEQKEALTFFDAIVNPGVAVQPSC